MPPVPLDEFPIHQSPLSLQYVASSDRNFYDRSYFNAHDRTGDLFLVTGYGVYPNLGVKDAYLTLRRGDRQWTARYSDALDDDRLRQQVGPYRVEVLEPLRTIRIVSDGDDEGLACDLTWRGSFDPVQEPHHVMRTGDRAILDACRFAQVGSWEGVIRVAGEELVVDPDVWLGTRDRSWGIRPVGESEPAGRNADELLEGFWWLYVPLRFDDFAIIVIAQEPTAGWSSWAGPATTSPTSRARGTRPVRCCTSPSPTARRSTSRSTPSGSSPSTWAPATAVTPTGATGSGRVRTSSSGSPTT